MLDQISTLQPHGGPKAAPKAAAGIHVLREVAASGKPTLEPRKRVRRKQQQRGCHDGNPQFSIAFAMLERVGR